MREESRVGLLYGTGKITRKSRKYSPGNDDLKQ
jgi:hypothetical protein